MPFKLTRKLKKSLKVDETTGNKLCMFAKVLVHGHRSLSDTILYVTDRIRFLPVTMTGRFSNFNSISYTEDRHELHVTDIEVSTIGNLVRHWLNIHFRQSNSNGVP